MSEKRLRTVAVPHPQATILDFKVAPGFQGHEDENLLCGECSLVLLEGVSEEFVAHRFATSVRLLVRCPNCRAYNALPSQWIPGNAHQG